jgi:hypothetical protein
MAFHQSTFAEYSEEESRRVLKGEQLLAPEQVMARLGITRRQLMALHRGENAHGLFIKPIRIGKKTMRYRIQDVLKLEWDAQQLEHSEF